MSKLPYLTLDFDGVVHSYTSKYTGPDEVLDPPTPGAQAAIESYLQHFTVAIFSSRSHQLGGRAAMFDWCHHHFGIAMVNRLEFPLHKPPALVTLDDRALTFTGPPWPDVETLRAFRPWNKK